MPKTDGITQERLKELLHYDPETGLFIWLVYRNPLARVGDVAGCPDKAGYIRIKIDGVLHSAHRMVFMYMLGWMPAEVDHDNQVKGDNRWENLNPATRTKNNKNKPLQSNNKSGYVGVWWDKKRKKWLAYIMVNKKHIYLGHFTDKSDAIAARQAADIKYGFHENHGNQST